MEKNYHAEAKILCIIHNWHKAVDGRGLSEETRAQSILGLYFFWLFVGWFPEETLGKVFWLISEQNKNQCVVP